MAAERRFTWGALFAMAATLALSIVPMPDVVAAWRPEWVAILLLYWSFTAPRRYGLFTAFMLGLALDVLTGKLLGQHALALIIIVYLSLRFHLRIRAFPLSQVAGTIIVLLATYEFVLFWIDGIAREPVTAMSRLWPLVTSAVLLTAVLALSDWERQDNQARMEI